MDKAIVIVRLVSRKRPGIVKVRWRVTDAPQVHWENRIEVRPPKHGVRVATYTKIAVSRRRQQLRIKHDVMPKKPNYPGKAAEMAMDHEEYVVLGHADRTLPGYLERRRRQWQRS